MVGAASGSARSARPAGARRQRRISTSGVRDAGTRQPTATRSTSCRRAPARARGAARRAASPSRRTSPRAAPAPQAGPPTSAIPRRRPRRRPAVTRHRASGWAIACWRLDPRRDAGLSGRQLHPVGAGSRAVGRPAAASDRCAADRPRAVASTGVPYYVTTPIYYVNGEPHLGHAYTTIAADVLARHMRQRGEDVFFLTGTDEHGEPVAQAAEKLGITPRELADKNAERFKEVAARVNATNDFFIRTSRPASTWRRSQEVLQRIHDNGHVYAGHLRGLLLPALRRLQDRRRADRGQQVPDPPDRARAREGGELVLPPVGVPGAARAAVRRPARLGAARSNRYNEALSFIKRGCNDLSLTRARPQLGRAGAVGPRAGHLRLDRRAAQLLHGAVATRARART